MKKRKTPLRRSRLVEQLRQRLQEAEDTLNAIRDGHVEALVVQAPEGERVYTLHSADQPYRLMVEQMQEGALTLADDGTILYCNSRFAELIALPPERITGRHVSRFVECDDPSRLDAMLSGNAFKEECRLRTAFGAANPAQLSATGLYIEGVRTVAVVVTDVTHEQIERGLRESNRLKDEFLATLSHELRTPLNVILGWTRMLLTDHLSDAARQHALKLIDRNAHAQAQLVNDLVDMSRVTTGKLRLELEPLRLVPALEAALESVRPAALAKDLTLSSSFDVTDVHVMADPTRLQQVMWNLLSNAIKFTPGGGRIVVRASAAGDRICIEVADSGIGIDRAFLPHVFDRFRQADSGSNRMYGGLGLGLAIVHDLVQLHGGEVEARSPGAGLGATFAVTLRAAPAPPAERRARSRQTASLAGHRILLVEDHQDSRELLVQALQNAGAAVSAFGSAGDAFGALEQVKPSAIVADIGLSGEDGYSLIRRIRAHSAEEIHSIPAIAVTAYATASDRAQALGVGFQQHLAKPVDPVRLIDAIHEVTRRTRRP
jgi:PAS domain S-box-containing protein